MFECFVFCKHIPVFMYLSFAPTEPESKIAVFPVSFPTEEGGNAESRTGEHDDIAR